MKAIAKFTLIFSLFIVIVLVKHHFFGDPSKSFYFLSITDVMFKAEEFLRKPTPIPYVENFVEYPVLIGVIVTILAYFSNSATDFFLLNGFSLSFFATINVLLAQELAWLVFGRKLAFFYLLFPSVLFFTFYNWDAIALFFLLLSLFLFYRRYYLLGSLFSFFGFWTKIFPIFSFGIFALSLFKRRTYTKVGSLVLLGVFVSVVLNLRYYLLNPKGIFYFFEFSRTRPPNIDSVWSSVYVLSDKIFGQGFFLKPYYNDAISFVALSSFLLLALVYLYFRWRKGNFHYLWDTTFIISIFLLTSKVYSPQFNLWLVPLLVICGLNFKKILLYDLLNLLVTWAVFQYFQEVFIVGRNILTFPYFKLFTLFVYLRHGLLIWLTYDLWKQRSKYD